MLEIKEAAVEIRFVDTLLKVGSVRVGGGYAAELIVVRLILPTPVILPPLLIASDLTPEITTVSVPFALL